MAKETLQEKKKWHHHVRDNGGHGAAVYGLGLIGALIYYLQHATTFASVLFGIIKAILWPAFIVFRLHEYLHL